MQQRNEFWDYWLAAQLTPLRGIKPKDTRIDAILLVYAAERAIASIIENKFEGLELCYQQIMALSQAVDLVSYKPNTGKANEEEIGHYNVAKVKEALDAFETALSIQFSQVNTFRVTAKGTQDIKKLIETPEDTFGKYWLGVTQAARVDWQSGAKCLAFELPTACGFHVLRAMEGSL